MKFSTKTLNKQQLFSSTVILPKTKFPLRLDSKAIIQRDETINNVLYILIHISFKKTYICITG